MNGSVRPQPNMASVQAASAGSGNVFPAGLSQQDAQQIFMVCDAVLSHNPPYILDRMKANTLEEV